MRALTKLDFLSLWESGAGMHPLDRGLLAIRAAFPDADDPAAWPLGLRNRALAELRCAAFGANLQGWIACPQCGEKLEFSMDARALAAEQSRGATEMVMVDGHAFRLPTSRDLARIAGEADLARAGRRLLEECRVGEGSARDQEFSDGESLGQGFWNQEFVDHVEEKLAAADPLAEIMVAFDCPVCGARCDKPLDLAAFLWAEVSAVGRRLLAEIHALASAYGWTQAEILSLSDARRHSYLEMVRA